MKKNNNSSFFEDWTTEELKEEAISYHQSIYEVQCYGSSDLRMLSGILAELENRGVEIKENISFQRS